MVFYYLPFDVLSTLLHFSLWYRELLSPSSYANKVSTKLEPASPHTHFSSGIAALCWLLIKYNSC